MRTKFVGMKILNLLDRTVEIELFRLLSLVNATLVKLAGLWSLNPNLLPSTAVFCVGASTHPEGIFLSGNSFE